MPPKQNAALLFHPKKKTGKDAKIPPPKPRAKPPGAPVVEPKAQQEDEEGFKLPETPYQEFRLLSSALKGWKYDVMKFDSRKNVDVLKWTEPVKLNRKDLRRDDRTAAATKVPQAVGPMVGPDGKSVIGADGKPVMVDAEGRPIHSTDGPSNAAKGKGPNNGRKRFQKKTKQVYIVPDEVRALTKEERYPWVMEDSSVPTKEYWIGQLEDASRAKTHAFFMPTANDAFKFVPAHRWYKFQKKLHHSLPTDTAEVESAYTQSQKRDPAQYLATLHGGRGASASTAALFKAEADVKPMIIDSMGPGGRGLKAVDQPMPGLFDDDEDGSSRRREMGGEGDLDEQEFEEEFADDEEMMVVDHDDEEAKNTEERLKREYKQANKQRETGIDESDDEVEGTPKKTKGGKKLKETLRKEGNNAYDSEDEENPYLSSAEEEEEEEEEVIQTGPAIQAQPQQIDNSRSNTPKPAHVKPTIPPMPGSRATSPASPSLGGHSLMAKRATSPKVPKARVPGAGSRATSPNLSGSRATSPLAAGTASPSNKRKADDVTTNGSSSPTHGQPKAKKKKVTPVTLAELEGLVVEWLKKTPNAKTRDCIAHFNPYLLDGDKKQEFAGIIKKLAFLKNGVLSLRTGATSSAT